MRWILLLLLLLAACEDVPSDEGTDLIHSVNTELGKLSADPHYPGAILSYNYTLINIGREDVFDIAVETRMRKKSTGAIVKTDAAILEMADLLIYKEAGMPIPQDVERGEYELTLVITYDDGTDASSFDFTVDREDEPAPKEEPEEPEDIKVVVDEPEEEAVEEGPEPTGVTHHVVIHDYAYVPADITIHVGDTIEWTNNDTVPHSATGPGFDSGPLAQGTAYSFTFTKAVKKPYSSTYTEGPAGMITIVEP